MQVLIKYAWVDCNIWKYIKDIFRGKNVTFSFNSLLVSGLCVWCLDEAVELFSNFT